MLNLLAVLVGGMLGTALRLGADAVIVSDAFPFATLTVNVTGSFLLGALVSRWWGPAPEWLRAGLGAGVLGSFTTFSAIMVSFVDGVAAGAWPLALVYLAATLVLGFAAAALGLRLGRSRTIDWVDE